MLILSIIFPIKNEAGNLEELFSRTIATMEKMQIKQEEYEIICIDDHSTDNSMEKINPFLKRANFKTYCFDFDVGHAKAIEKGIEISSDGHYTLLMDADLQYNPEEIPFFVEAIKKNPQVHIVNGWRVIKKDEFLKKLASKIYNYLCRKMFGTALHDHASNFTLFLNQDLKNIELEHNDQRYIIAIVKYKFQLEKSQVIEVPIQHNPRIYGKSKYPLWKKVFFGIFEIRRKKKSLELLYPRS